eukprot:TRINITY_DN83490_c0_g1_i1.p1 TRINITY_DN83490_c0_g1~~TRINITY_DN83490_c0_g1_i1.p1  ORF type:complete len:244 (+),score=31.66 TRINITY_DN83490_c0_g1_i1:88-819(+)
MAALGTPRQRPAGERSVGVNAEKVFRQVHGIHPVNAGFVRYDPMREAQELLAEQRQLMPPRPSSRHMREDPSKAVDSLSTASAREDVYAENRQRAQQIFGRTMALGPTGRAAMDFGKAPMHEGHQCRQNSSSWAVRRRTDRLRVEAMRPHKMAEMRTKAMLEERFRKQQEIGQEAPMDHHRRNVIRNEVRASQGRWPPEARWAGFSPDEIPESFEKKGTLSTERADGRTLPHERPDKWFWPGA